MSSRSRHHTELTGNASSFNRATRSARSHASSLRTTILGLGGALGATFGARAIFNQVRSVTRLASEMQNLERQTGISSTRLRQLRFTLGTLDIEFNTFLTGTRNLEQRLISAGDGLQTYVRIFDELGLSIEALNNQAPDQRLLSVLEALERIDDVGRRRGLASQLFGGRAEALLRIDTGTFSQQVARDASITGVISQADNARLAEANRQFDLIGEAIRNTFTLAVVDNADQILAISRQLREHLPDVVNGLSDLADVVSNLFGFIADNRELVGALIGARIGASTAGRIASILPPQFRVLVTGAGAAVGAAVGSAAAAATRGDGTTSGGGLAGDGTDEFGINQFTPTVPVQTLQQVNQGIAGSAGTYGEPFAALRNARAELQETQAQWTDFALTATDPLRASMNEFVQTGDISIKTLAQNFRDTLTGSAINQVFDFLAAGIGRLAGGGSFFPSINANQGADFIVRGRSGIDTNPVRLNLTNNERVRVTPAGETDNEGVTINNDVTINGTDGVAGARLAWSQMLTDMQRDSLISDAIRRAR